MSTHHILRQVFELGYSSQADAYRLQDRFSNLQRSKLQDIIEKVLEEAAAEFDTVRIEHLELDLGDISPEDIDLLLPIRLEAALRDAIYLSIKRAEFDPTVQVIQLSKERSRWEFLLNYLRTGTLAWSAQKEDLNTLKKWLFEKAADIPAEWRQELKQVLRATRSRERAVALLASDTVDPLLQLIFPSYEKDVVLQRWQQYLEVLTGDEAEVWTERETQQLMRHFMKEVLGLWSVKTGRAAISVEIAKAAIERTEEAMQQPDNPLLKERAPYRGKATLVQAISHYLYYGYWPADAERLPEQDIMAALRQAAIQSPEMLRVALQRSLRRGVARKRIAYQFQPEVWAEIAGMASPQWVEHVRALAGLRQLLTAPQAGVTRLMRTIYTAMLQAIAEQPGQPPETAELEEIVKRSFLPAGRQGVVSSIASSTPQLQHMAMQLKAATQNPQEGFGVLEALMLAAQEAAERTAPGSSAISDEEGFVAPVLSSLQKVEPIDNEIVTNDTMPAGRQETHTTKPGEAEEEVSRESPTRTKERDSQTHETPPAETRARQAEKLPLQDDKTPTEESEAAPPEFGSVQELIRYFLRTGIWPVLTEESRARLGSTERPLTDPFVLITQLLEGRPADVNQLLATVYPLLRSEKVLLRITSQLPESVQLQLAEEFIKLQPPLQQVQQFQQAIQQWLAGGKAAWEKLLSPKAFTFITETSLSQDALVFSAELPQILARSLRMAVLRMIYDDQPTPDAQEMVQQWIEYAAGIAYQGEASMAALIVELARQWPLQAVWQQQLQTIAQRYASFKQKTEIAEQAPPSPEDETPLEDEAARLEAQPYPVEAAAVSTDIEERIDEETLILTEIITEGGADALTATYVSEKTSEEKALNADRVPQPEEVDEQLATTTGLEASAPEQKTPPALSEAEAQVAHTPKPEGDIATQQAPADNDVAEEQTKTEPPRYTPSEESMLPVLDLIDLPFDEPEHTNHRSLKEKLNLPVNRKQQPQQEPDQSRRREEEPPLSELPEDVIFVENAGMVMLWPYIAMCFKKLGYTDQGAFRSPDMASRAVHLLQYMVTGEEQPPEHLLPLNKLLCGIPVFEVVERDIILTLREKEEGQALLEAVVAHWEQMKNLTVAALRESFLRRNGKLAPGDVSWTLKVEPAGYDVLMDSLPWNLGMVKLKWMEKLLIVEWR